MTEQTNVPHRSWGERSAEDDRTLYWAVTIGLAVLVFAAIGTVGHWVGWWTIFLATLASIVVAGSTLLLFFRQKEKGEATEPHGENTSLLAHFGYDDADEIEAFGVKMAPMLPLHGEDEDDPVADYHGDYAAPQPKKWRVIAVAVWRNQHWRFVMSVICWPHYFWRYLCQYPSEDTTDRAEDWMWLGFFVAIPGLMFIGWGSEGSTIPFWVVLISYAVSGLLLGAILTYRRNTAN